VGLRSSDIPCREDHDFLVLLPATDEQGARSACARLEPILNDTQQTSEGASFQVLAFLGLSSSNADPGVSAERLLEEAYTAMNEGRSNRTVRTVVFSEIK
jgi:PleD family two-component response regulator